jgi:hypothetical protein
MGGARHHVTMSGRVASEFVSHQPPGRLALLLEKPAKEAGGGFPVPPCLDEDIQDLAILIHRSIQIPKLPGDTHEDFIDVPLVAARTRSLS